MTIWQRTRMWVVAFIATLTLGATLAVIPAHAATAPRGLDQAQVTLIQQYAAAKHISFDQAKAELDAFFASLNPALGFHHPDPNVERWHATALNVGWPQAQWICLSRVIERESHGNPGAYNGRHRDRSYGLTQLNTKGSLFNWFASVGVTSRWSLFDPTVNLATALRMWQQRGWGPWRGCPSR